MLNQRTTWCTFRKLASLWLGFGVIILLLSGCGSQVPKTYHVGILFSQDSFVSISNGFKARMAELGYVEGKNIVYDAPKATADKAAQQTILKKFIDEKVDLIFSFGTDAALTAKATAQGTIPVEFAFSTIEGNDMVESVREPGGNVTGVRYPGPELTAKRFELLHEILPQLKRLYVAYDPNYSTVKSALESLRPAVAAAGVTLVEAPVADDAALAADLDARDKAADIGLDAILILPEHVSQTPASWAALSKFAAAHHVPIAGNTIVQAQQGALFNYAPDLAENGQLAAGLADKILKGTPAGTIPVVTPESQLLLNYKVAQQLGLTIPSGIMKQAVQIIR